MGEAANGTPRARRLSPGLHTVVDHADEWPRFGGPYEGHVVSIGPTSCTV
jgi:hypothetical protein